MKLISLNIWGGKVYEPLLKFFERYANEADIFCLQEVLFGTEPMFTQISRARENIFFEIAERLPNFASHQFHVPDVTHFVGELLHPGVGAGQAIFVRKPMEIVSANGFRVGKREDKRVPVSGNFAHAEVRSGGGTFIIGNLHGIWVPDGKGDTPERLKQSRILTAFFKGYPHAKHILCGDFNLRPETQSIAIFEAEGMKNLLREYGVTLTRSELYADMKGYNDPIADYAFVSPNVRVRDFRVLPDVVSDHLPLLLDFS